ncbi:MAG: hypothetical protein QOI95_3518 [Acidimicrobiaceae bacterium]|jgi:glycosyltransferase involved in cell wall biosynthesis
MTRVLLVHGNVEWYGSDRSLVLLATALRAAGTDVVVSMPGRGGAHGHLVEAGIPVTIADPAPIRPRVFSKRQWVVYVLRDLPLAVQRFRRLARRFDVVHINTSNLLGGILGAGLARRPVVLHVRETYAGHERQWRTYCRVIRPFVSAVIATSADIAAETSTAGLGDRVRVVPNGVEFTTHDAPRPLDSGSGPVVAIGRLNDWKGHDVLIEAVALLRDRGVTIRVEIAGDTFPGQEHRREELERLASDRGVGDRVRLLGYVDDIDGLLARAAMFVLPSVRPEPFGLVLVDAMAHGLACIATDAGGPRDIVRQGETGILVPPGDTAALADAIERVHLDDPLRVLLGNAAAADVRARFSITTTAEAVLAVYASLTPS